MTKPESAAIICRVSSREQEDGYSLEAQGKLLRDYCERKGFEVSFALSFSETASKYHQRKKFREFLAEVKRSQINHIVVEKVDRLSRSGSRDAVLIDEWIESDANRHVHFVKQSLDIHKFASSSAKFVLGMQVAVAKHMSDNLSEEIRKSVSVMLSKGIWPTHAPIGYFRDRNNPAVPMQISPVNAGIIRDMFKLYATGRYSVARLTEQANSQGLRNTLGNRLTVSRVHLMLQDPFYIGKMNYGGKTYMGSHEAIVPKHVFDAVQQRLKRKSTGKGASAYRSHDHLFRGVVTCVGCGRRLTWEIQKDQTYGYCRNRNGCLAQARTRQSDIEAIIGNHLKLFLLNDSRLSALIYRQLKRDQEKRGDSTTGRVDAIKGELSRTTAKLDRLVDLRVEGEITKEEFETKRNKLQEELLELEASVKSLRAFPTPEITPLDVYKLGQKVHKEFTKATIERKREIVAKVFASIEVGNEKTECIYTPPFTALKDAIQSSSRSNIPKISQNTVNKFERLKSVSANQKSQPVTTGYPDWRTGWEGFRKLGEPSHSIP